MASDMLRFESEREIRSKHHFLTSVDVDLDGEQGVLWQWFARKGNGRGDDTNMVKKITPRIKMFQTLL